MELLFISCYYLLFESFFIFDQVLFFCHHFEIVNKRFIGRISLLWPIFFPLLFLALPGFF